MGNKRLGWAAACGLIAALVWLIWFGFDRATSRQPRRSVPDATEAPATAGTPSESADVDVARTARHTLRVLVRTETELVSGAIVEARPDSWRGTWSRDYVPSATATTNVDGVATLVLAHDGFWEVDARARGFGAVRGRVVVCAATHELTLRMTAGTPLTGTVRDEAGRPLADVAVTAGPSAGMPGMPGSVVARTNEAGRYRLEDLPPGRLRVAAGDPPGHSLEIQLPFTGDFDLVLRARGAIAGRVFDHATGRGLAGVTVRFLARGYAYAVTDAEGRYRCDGLTVGRAMGVSVRAPDYIAVDERGIPGPINATSFRDPTGPRGRARLAIPIQPGKTTPYDIALRRGVTLRGVVRGPDGPMAGAQVWVSLQGRARVPIPPATTDDAGRYEVRGLYPGLATVRAHLPGYYDPDAPSVVVNRDPDSPSRIELPREGSLEKNLRLVRAERISGRVVDADGELVPGVLVSAVQRQLVLRAVSDEDGLFVVEGPRPGHDVKLFASVDGFAQEDDIAVEPGASDVEVVVHRMPVVKGQVLDEQGETVPDAPVLVLQEAGGTAASTQIGAASTVTEPNGSFQASLRSRKKPFSIEVRARGYVRGRAGPFDPNALPATIDIVVRRGAVLSGVVRGADGAPISGAAVRVAPERYRGYPWHVPARTATDAEGKFRIESVEGERVLLIVTAHGFRPHQAVTQVAGDLVVELKRSLALSGSVRFRDGRPAAGVRVAAFAAGEQRWDMYSIVRPEAQRGDGIPVRRREARTDPRGAFTFADLEAGRYRIEVVPDTQGRTLRRVNELNAAAGSSDAVLVVEEAPPGAFGWMTDEEIGRAARYMVLRKDHKRAAELWRALVDRKPDVDTAVEATLELARSLDALGAHEENERRLREAATRADARSARGLMVRYRLARTVLARDRAEEARTIAREVASATAVDRRAAAYGSLALGLAESALGNKDAARTALQAAGVAAAALEDQSLVVLVRNAVRTVLR